MTPLKLVKYTGDDHSLLEVADAEFLRRKVTPETQLDFNGVAEVSAAFLDAMLDGETPESVGERLWAEFGLLKWRGLSAGQIKDRDQPRRQTYPQTRRAQPAPETQHRAQRQSDDPITD